VIGTARNGIEALELARKLQPDMIAMDIQMPQMDGLEATRLINAEMPNVKIIMLTASADEQNLFEALRAGASGYLLKGMSADEFLTLLGETSRGEAELSAGLANKMLEVFTHGKDSIARKATEESLTLPSGLTQRQVEVLQLVGQGLMYKEVGAQLFLTERTVKYHMGEILTRLQLKGRREAIDYAQRRGLA
jgi:two-component system NarL family response regulator